MSWCRIDTANGKWQNKKPKTDWMKLLKMSIRLHKKQSLKPEQNTQNSKNWRHRKMNRICTETHIIFENTHLTDTHQWWSVWIHIAYESLFCNCYYYYYCFFFLSVMDKHCHSKHEHLLLLSRTVCVCVYFHSDQTVQLWPLIHSLTRSILIIISKIQNAETKIYMLIQKTIDTYRCVYFRCEWSVHPMNQILFRTHWIYKY